MNILEVGVNEHLRTLLNTLPTDMQLFKITLNKKSQIKV